MGFALRLPFVFLSQFLERPSEFMEQPFRFATRAHAWLLSDLERAFGIMSWFWLLLHHSSGRGVILGNFGKAT
jgi:hypothetical protein